MKQLNKDQKVYLRDVKLMGTIVGPPREDLDFGIGEEGTLYSVMFPQQQVNVRRFKLMPMSDVAQPVPASPNTQEWDEECDRYAALCRRWLANQADKQTLNDLIESGVRLGRFIAAK